MTTSFRIRQAHVAQASQAEAEAESNVDKYLPPDLAKHGPWAAKGWGLCNATGTALDSSHNMDALTDNAVGDRGFNWTVDFSSVSHTDLAQILVVSSTLVHVGHTASQAAGATRVLVVIEAGGLVDEPTGIAAFGDQ